MKRFSVLDYQYCDMEEGDFSDEEFSTQPDSYTTHTVEGIYESKYGDLITNLNLDIGDEVYLLYVIWSTGSSFSQDHGKYLTPIHLFDTCEKAEVAVAAIYAHAKKNDANGPDPLDFLVEYIGNDGSIQTEHAGWIGYFESIDDVRCELVEVIKRPKNAYC